jgi:hypothetical protein
MKAANQNTKPQAEVIYKNSKSQLLKNAFNEQDFFYQKDRDLKSYPSFLNYLMNSEYIMCDFQWYYDIIFSDTKRPDYKTIQALCVIKANTVPYDGWDILYYDKYKIKTKRDPYQYGHAVAFNWIKTLNNDIAAHLLGKLVDDATELCLAYYSSYSKLQSKLNETKENIVSAINFLNSLNLIFFKESENDKLIIEINKEAILAITPRDFDKKETVEEIEKYYGITLSREDEEEYCGGVA